VVFLLKCSLKFPPKENVSAEFCTTFDTCPFLLFAVFDRRNYYKNLREGGGKEFRKLNVSLK